MLWCIAPFAHLLLLLKLTQHIGGKMGSRFEARSIAIAKSASSIAHCWNHSWQASPRCFPYTIATRVNSMQCGTRPQKFVLPSGLCFVVSIESLQLFLQYSEVVKSKTKQTAKGEGNKTKRGAVLQRSSDFGKHLIPAWKHSASVYQLHCKKSKKIPIRREVLF